MALLWLVFERTLLGAQIRAAVDNRRMAQSVGINVDRAVHADLRLRQRHGGARRRARDRHRRPVADLRDPVPGAVPDRGRGRRHGQPLGRLPGRADPGLPRQRRQVSLARGRRLLHLRRDRRSCCSPGPRGCWRAAAAAEPGWRPPPPGGGSRARHRLRPIEALPWALAVAAFFLFPDYAYLGTQVLILILFALSLDLILGYAGIVTLGHAAYFGLGAYVAGHALGAPRLARADQRPARRGGRGRAVRLALRPDPVALPRPRAADADARGRHHADGGGERARGLDRRLRRPVRHHAGAAVRPLRERPLSATPTTGTAWRCCSWPSCSAGASSIRRSACRSRACARTSARMRAIGCDVLRAQGRDLHDRGRARRARGRPVRPGQRLRDPGRVQLRTLGHGADRADPGRRRPAVRRLRRRHRATICSRISSPSSAPSSGSSASALVLVLVVLFWRGGLLGLLDLALARCAGAPGCRATGARRRERAARARDPRAAQELRRPRRHRRRRPPARARQPPGADRAERRRQDHADQPDQRRARAERRPGLPRRPRRHALPQHARARLGLARTFQINQLFREPRGGRQRRARARRAHRLEPPLLAPARRRRALLDEAFALLETLGLATRRCSRSAPCPTAASGWSRSRSRSPRAPRSCCSTSPRPACRRPRAT